MKRNTSTKIGCLAAVVLLVMIVALYRPFASRDISKGLETDGISWAKAAEKCKDRYKTISSSWKVKVSNARKRTEDDDYFYYSWSKPMAIFVEQSSGKKTINKGKCQVDRKSGEIVYMTFNKSVVINKPRKNK